MSEASVIPLHGGARMLPCNLEAEKSILGAVLMYPGRLAEVSDILRPEDFLSPPHQAIYAAMLQLDAAGRAVDSVAVEDSMRATDSMGRLCALGGVAYFAELTSACASVENVRFHARIVHGKSLVRQMMEAAQAIAAQGYGNYGETDEYLDAAEKAVFEVAQSRHQDAVESIQPILKRTIRGIEVRFERKQVITGIPTGYVKLDEITGGFQPSDLIVIAGRPSMGKTALALCIVSHASIDCRVPALVFSLEMSKEALTQRLISSRARIDSVRLRSGMLETRDWISMTRESAAIHVSPISIDETGAPNLQTIRARARRWRSQNPLPAHGVIVVDYLQLIDTQKLKSESDASAVGRMTRGLKALAKELRVPVVILSQLNRGVESRADKRPMMSDLRESGAIEQDADVIAFVYRDEVYDDNCDDKGIAEIIIRKQRNGDIGTVKLRFQGEFTRFEDMT